MFSSQAVVIVQCQLQRNQTFYLVISVDIRKKLKETLKEMKEKRVIRTVDEPTDWVNSLVVIKNSKSDKLRVCLDPRSLNVRFHCHDYLYKS
jgi:hypothetical protein